MRFFQIAKRVSLFILVNLLVVVTISLVLNILGVRPYLSAQGIDYSSLMAFCLIWGFGGAFISLALSRVMAKWMMGVKVIDAGTHDSELQGLVHTVHRLARQAGLTTMPQVGVYDSPELNAFATGPTRSRALVAVSTGMLHGMNSEQIEGVLGHEISHISNGDMVTMTLLQGVINAFVMFLARVLAFAITQATRDRDSERGGGGYFMQYMLTMVFEMVLALFGAIVVAWFSRWREFRADAGSARLAGREPMIAALRGLQRVYENPRVAEGLQEATASQPALVQTLKIATPKGRGFLALFSSHPPLEERIQRLETMTSV